MSRQGLETQMEANHTDALVNLLMHVEMASSNQFAICTLTLYKKAMVEVCRHVWEACCHFASHTRSVLLSNCTRGGYTRGVTTCLSQNCAGACCDLLLPMQW